MTRAAAAGLLEVLQGHQMYAMWCMLHILYCQKNENILRWDTCILLIMNKLQAFYHHDIILNYVAVMHVYTDINGFYSSNCAQASSERA